MIRNATPDDIPTLVALGARMHEESPTYRDTPYDPERAAMVGTRVMEAGGLFVYDVGGEMVGMALGMVFDHFWSGTPTGGELLIYVAPEHRYGGGGVRLIRALEKWARSKGAEQMSLGVTTGINPEGTLRLYQRLGYARMGETFSKAL